MLQNVHSANNLCRSACKLASQAAVTLQSSIVSNDRQCTCKADFEEMTFLWSLLDLADWRPRGASNLSAVTRYC